MSLVAIQAVAAAESEADKLLSETAAEAKRIVAAAEAAGKEKVQNAVESAESAAADICREAEEEASKAAAQAARETREECLALESEAESRMDKAVAAILERVVGGA